MDQQIAGVAYCVALMFFGLGICFFSKEARYAFLMTLFWWVGVIVAVIGLLIVVLRIAEFVLHLLRGATGV